MTNNVHLKWYHWYFKIHISKKEIVMYLFKSTCVWSVVSGFFSHKMNNNVNLMK